MKKLIAILFFGLAVFSLTGCNTLKGAGQDIENAGQKLDEAI